jgi:hypothetical protein
LIEHSQANVLSACAVRRSNSRKIFNCRSQQFLGEVPSK